MLVEMMRHIYNNELAEESKLTVAIQKKILQQTKLSIAKEKSPCNFDLNIVSNVLEI